jgi:hypothetical protein
LICSCGIGRTHAIPCSGLFFFSFTDGYCSLVLLCMNLMPLWRRVPLAAILAEDALLTCGSLDAPQSAATAPASGVIHVAPVKEQTTGVTMTGQLGAPDCASTGRLRMQHAAYSPLRFILFMCRRVVRVGRVDRVQSQRWSSSIGFSSRLSVGHSRPARSEPNARSSGGQERARSTAPRESVRVDAGCVDHVRRIHLPLRIQPHTDDLHEVRRTALSGVRSTASSCTDVSLVCRWCASLCRSAVSTGRTVGIDGVISSERSRGVGRGRRPFVVAPNSLSVVQLRRIHCSSRTVQALIFSWDCDRVCGLMMQAAGACASRRGEWGRNMSD